MDRRGSACCCLIIAQPQATSYFCVTQGMKFDWLSTFISVLAFLSNTQQEHPASSSVMTKRTASLAAATKNIAAKARKIAKESPTVGSESVSANSFSSDQDNSDNNSKPWYTVFSKSDTEYNRYMATEWGFEKRGDTALFEKICLEGAQSGLSWLTILKKREAYRRCFHQFDISKVSRMTAKDVQNILDSDEEDPTNMVVRHRGKIEATINNGRCIQDMYKEEAGREEIGKKENLFDSFLWSFVGDKPILNTTWKQGQSLAAALSKTPESEAMSKALKKRGFRFVGPTTCYAMMQSVGMVIDHPVGTPEWEAALKRLKQRPGGYQKDTDVRGNIIRDEGATKETAAAKKAKAKTTASTASSSTVRKERRNS